MRVIHIPQGKTNPTGHNVISRVVYHLSKEERAQGISSEISRLVDEARSPFSQKRDDYVKVKCFPRVRLPFGRNTIFDRLGIRQIITTHGIYLKPHAMTCKQRIAPLIYELLNLNASIEVHPITEEENVKPKAYSYRGRTSIARMMIENYKRMVMS